MPPDVEDASAARQPADAETPARSTPARLSRRWTALALAAFLLAIAATHGAVWREGARDVVPTGVMPLPEASSTAISAEEATARHAAIQNRDRFVVINRGDAVFESWLVGRNAETLLRRPGRLFDTEHCWPAEKTLTLGVPMIAMSILGIPAQLAMGDPVLTYNFALLAMALASAFAMYWLVAEWTAVPAAGIVAGLLYAFHPLRLSQIIHPAEWDTSWTVFALLFARRLFAFGRWRDAVGLAAAIAMQMAATFYQLVGALFFVPPFALWLCLHYRFARVRIAQLVFVACAAAISAWLLYGPYLETRSASPELLHRSFFFYAAWSEYLPTRQAFPGWLLLALALAGLPWLRRANENDAAGDPRWSLLAGAGLVAILSAGYYNNELLQPFWSKPPFLIPDLYASLARVVPGLDAVRAVARLSMMVVLAFCVLAGFGVAALMRRAGRFETPLAAGLILLALVGAVRPDWFGASMPQAWEFYRVRPHPESVAFFDQLARAGNDGALLELPYYADFAVGANPDRIMLTAHHHRRTSACYGSFIPPKARAIAELATRLPDPAVVRELRELGFTTVVVHLDEPRGPAVLRQLLDGDGKALRRLVTLRTMVAFELPR